MTTNEERMQVLKMIENRQITAAEGAKLLEAIDTASGKEQQAAAGRAPRWFRVRITDKLTGKPKVNVNIPMGLVNVGMRMGAKFAPDMAGLDLDEVMQAVKHGAQGKIIEVDNEEEAEHVEIYVE
jgi:hypothetical protein